MVHEPLKAFLWSLCRRTKARKEPLCLRNVGFGGEDTHCKFRARFLFLTHPVVSGFFKNKLASEGEASCISGGFLGFFQNTSVCSLKVAASPAGEHWTRGQGGGNGGGYFKGKKFCYFWVVDGIRSVDPDIWETCHSPCDIQLCRFITGQGSGLFPLWLMKYQCSKP